MGNTDVTTPAQPGETISIAGTGFGSTDPAQPTGQVMGAPAGLANPVQVTIGGQDPVVVSAALVGSGLYQINLTIPSLPDGDATVSAQVGGVQTQAGALITVQ